MMGGIMRLSAKVQQLNVAIEASSRLTARVAAALRLTFLDGKIIMLPMAVNKAEIQLKFKARMVKLADEQAEEWYASVRPVVSAPDNADSSFWCLLYSAIVNGAQSQLELTYSAGAPGSNFLPVGRQDFAVKLQQYDPLLAQRPDLKPQFVLPKHVLISHAVDLLLQSWDSNPVDVRAMWMAVTNMAAHCFSVQCKLVKASFEVAACSVSDDLMQVLEEMSSADSVAIRDGAWDCTGLSEPGAKTTSVLLRSVIDALQVSARAELRPFPSVAFVTMSLLASLGLFRASRPQLGAVADYM
jgi:hypothetical protein